MAEKQQTESAAITDSNISLRRIGLRGRTPLSTGEILELESALKEVFRTIRRVKCRIPTAQHIKFPSIPAIFSESIAITATPLLFGPDWTGCYGGRASDIIVANVKTRQSHKVEVKATGRHGFQELKDKDLRADFLVWIRFGLSIEEGVGSIETIVVERPGNYFSGQRRLDARRFEAVAGVLNAQKLFRFGSLAEMLSVGGAQR